MTEVNEIFIDTSIAIAAMIHSSDTKKRIAERIRLHSGSVTSLIVKQEFKRRLLKEAQYLLNQLNSKGSFRKVLRHVSDILPPQQERKRNICLDMMLTVFEQAEDAELTERAKKYLRALLRTGLREFEERFNSIVWASGCACSTQPVVEREKYRRYDFGEERCSKTRGACGVIDFLQSKRSEMERVLQYLRSIRPDKKTIELQRSESFIMKVVADCSMATNLDPCLSMGDLMIALESMGIPVFYTLNGKESQHLCRALGQSLVVRKKNPEHEDVVCQNTDPEWPEF